MIKKVALILALVVAGVLGAAAPAQAAPSCPVGLLCWFDSSNWTAHNYKVATGSVTPGVCYNMGTDPNTGINWNDIIDSVWFNNWILNSTHVTFFGNPGCSSPNAYVTKAWANGVPGDQMQSCQEPWGIWNGPCGGTGSNRISSWKLTY